MVEAFHHPRNMTPETLAQVMGETNWQMYAWPVLMRKAMRLLWETRNPTAAMFAWQSNVNYRNVSSAGHRCSQ